MRLVKVNLICNSHINNGKGFIINTTVSNNIYLSWIRFLVKNKSTIFKLIAKIIVRIFLTFHFFIDNDKNESKIDFDIVPLKSSVHKMETI